MISDSNRSLAKTLAKVFGGKPTVARYWDEHGRYYVDVMTCEDSLQENVISYGTLGLSDHPIREEKLRVEFVAAFGVKFEEGANVLATAAFCLIRSKWQAQPGAIFPDVVGMYRKGSDMKHLLLCSPFLWDELVTQELSDKTVAWLLLVPISENELRFVEANGSSALEDLFVEKQIDVYDLDRRSVL